MMCGELIVKWATNLKNKRLYLMSDDELSCINVPRRQNKGEELFVQSFLIDIGAIPLSQLKENCTYIGFCRNASEAVWNGKKFVYKRTKYGKTYDEEIKHFQQDDGYDVFVPVRLKEDTDKINKVKVNEEED